MMIRSRLLIGVRVAAAIAVVVFAVLAYNRSTADVTFTFPASDTVGLADDVDYKCGSAPTSLDTPASVVNTDWESTYEDWALAKTKENGTPPDTTQVKLAACEAARDSRIITLIWLVAAALASAMVLLAASLVPANPRTYASRESNHGSR